MPIKKKTDKTGSRRRPPGEPMIRVEFEDGIAWVTLNRPQKRNAMSPALNREMIKVLDALEVDDRCRVLVLTGAGESSRPAWTWRVLPRNRQRPARSR